MSRLSFLVSLSLCVSLGCFKGTGGSDCDDDGDCDTGMACVSGECVMTRCLDTADCDPGLVCRAGACVAPRVCEEDCDGTCDDGACRACLTDSECADGPCIIGRCFTACSDVSMCAAGEACHRGVCGSPCDEFDLCTELVNNSIELVVNEGEALRPSFTFFGCQLSGERSVDSFCDGTLINSVTRAPRLCDPCLASADGCGDGQTCVNGDCTCSTQADCPGTLACTDGFCGVCGGDEECECDQYCSAGECLPACSLDEDCGAGFVCAAGRCAGCRDDSECGASARCYEDGCVQPCSEGEAFCDLASGRSRFCALFSPIGESAVMACE